MEVNRDTKHQVAPLWKRAFAYTLDIAIQHILTLVIAVVLALYFKGLDMMLPMFYFSLVLHFYYDVYLVGCYSATPGKMILRLSISTQNGKQVEFFRALIRASPFLLTSVISSWLEFRQLNQLLTIEPGENAWPLLVNAPQTIFDTICVFLLTADILCVFLNQDRRALHDYLAGTIVILDREFSDSSQSGAKIAP